MDKVNILESDRARQKKPGCLDDPLGQSHLPTVILLFTFELLCEDEIKSPYVWATILLAYLLYQISLISN